MQITKPISGDVLLFQTTDDGDIKAENGVIELTQSFETAVYISLFGGNFEGEWWGNADINDPAFKQVSQTQIMIEGLPAITGNLIRIKEAVEADLKWMIDKNIASSVLVSISIPALNKIKIVVNVKAEGEMTQFEFVENWESK